MPNEQLAILASVRSILFWLSGALGDTLLAFPALGALRRAAPVATITVVGRPAYLRFAAWAGVTDRVLDVDGQLAGDLLAGAAPPGFTPPDCAVIYSAAYERIASHLVALGVPAVVGSPAHAADGRHQARYLLDCLRPLGVDRRVLPVTLPGSAVLGNESDMGAADRPRILLHAGAGARWKRWPLARYLVLAMALRAQGAAVWWSCGPADVDLRAALHASAAAVAGRILPEQELDALATFMARCDLVLTPDTGIAHLAALLDVPQVTLFGPTDPGRWRPLSRRARILRAPDRCGGHWEFPPMGSADGLRRSLARCRPFDVASCRCLAALPIDTVLAACSRG